MLTIKPSTSTAKLTARKTNPNALFFILALLFTGLLYFLYQIWPYLLVQSMHWQKEINDVLANLLIESKSNNLHAILYFSGLSFAYGILHSLGPGHGKVIVTTYLSTHPTKVKTSLWLTVTASITQALVAICLVTTLLWVFNASMREVNNKSFYFMDASSLIMALLGILMIYNGVKNFVKARKNREPAGLSIQKMTPITDAAHSMQPLTSSLNLQSYDTNHQHDANCGCGHQHFVAADDINNANNFKQYLLIILGIGMRPCTGAIMVLLFSHVMGLYWLGVLSSFLMGIGTALTISAIALLTLSGKKIIQIYQGSSRFNMQYVSLIGKTVAGLLLIIIGLLMAQTQNFAVASFLR
ncbi:nickel/cobalt transporter [Vibrio sp. S11_S32]|uniref:nickel/cobalt transporter n=1 Tax=Vibrio sp. S11_S32 TaxID=2720225 RepID=UPI0016819ED6|nr:nickel/cobalt transporter [Vibrio sp. S11_S32]MBD1575213.1 nickel/cobalt transporter [Vibrio sp. S11_S32]